MPRSLTLLWCSCLAWVALLLLGCGHGEELARLQAVRGTVERDVANKQGVWGGAAVGASFVVGDGVRTAKAATAELKLSDGSGLTLQEKSLLRFLASPPGKKSRGLALEAGEVELDVGASGLEIETPAGPATLDPGTRAQMHALIKPLWEKHRITVILVTHDIKEAFALGTRLVALNHYRADPQAPGRYGATITYDFDLDPNAPVPVLFGPAKNNDKSRGAIQ